VTEKYMDKREVLPGMRLVGLLVPFLVTALCGCANARIVRETPDGGVIAIPMNNNCWPMYYRNRAEKLMSQKCPGGYRIEREEFVWDGKPGTEGHRAHESYFGYTDPHDEMAPYLRKEYWIAFRAAAPGSQRPATNAPAKPGSSPSTILPPSPPASPSGDELPPPRPLKGVQE
jgi:hypothetical protein